MKPRIYRIRYTAPLLRRLLLSLLGAVLLCPATAEPVRMTFLSPDPEGQFWFWNKTIEFMRDVAEDLNIEFEVVATQGISTYSVKKDGLSIINREDPPDFILTGYWNESVGDLLAAADENSQFFLFNAPVMEADKAGIQGPRERFSHWIGQMYPDEDRAGFDLARILLDRARKLPANADRDAVEVAALTGDELSSVSRSRETGMRRAVAESGATLTAVTGTAWRGDAGHRATEGILGEHPGTTVIWTVTDALALGAIKALEEQGLQAGTDILIGGFDGSEQGLQAIRDNEMTASMGGHFLEGGWAMILAYDYHRGNDFAGDLGTTISSSMRAITADNLDRYTKLINGENLEKIDFSRLSKTHNPELAEYDFSVEIVLELLDACEDNGCE